MTLRSKVITHIRKEVRPVSEQPTGLLVKYRIADDGTVLSEEIVGTCDGDALLDDTAKIFLPRFNQWLEQRERAAPKTGAAPAK